jgi:hypothetical protein
MLIFVLGMAVGLPLSVVVSVSQGETNYAVLFAVAGFEMFLGFLILFEYRQVKLAAAKQYGLSKREAVRLDISCTPLFDESLELIMRVREDQGVGSGVHGCGSVSWWAEQVSFGGSFSIRCGKRGTSGREFR